MSQISARLKEGGQTHSMELIFFPLFLICIVGMIFNALNGSGLEANGQLETTTSMCLLNIDPNCSPIIYSQPIGCAANPQNCNASSITGFSILNQNSPFTFLMERNLVGFWTSVFGSGETENQYLIGETLCVPVANGHYVNSTSPNIQNFGCFGNVQYQNAQLPYVLPPLNATSNYGNNSIFSIVGCPETVICGIGFTNITYAHASFYGIYIRNGTVLDSTHGCTIYGSSQICGTLFPNLFGSEVTFTCPNGSQEGIGVNFAKTTYYCLIPTSNPATFSVANTFSFFAMIAGMILLFMGLGLNFAFSILTNGGTLGVNEQGTKMAQVMGIGLVVWSFITSEFAYWVFFNYQSGFIGTLLSLVFTSMYSVLTVIFFLGLYWRIFSLD
jgi:hypothetical protein